MERITAAQAAERITAVLDTFDMELSEIVTTFHDEELDSILARLWEIAKEYDALQNRTSTCCQSSPLAA